MKAPIESPAPNLEPVIGLRDYFAAHLAAAILVAPKQVGVPRPDMEAMAGQAFEFADAMLRVRSR